MYNIYILNIHTIKLYSVDVRKIKWTAIKINITYTTIINGVWEMKCSTSLVAFIHQ